MENNYTINSKEYWNDRFIEDWESSNGVEQTKYFAELTCSLLPEWLIKDICRNSYEVCDLGCAEGDALPILQKVFPMSKIMGEDFSDKAIDIARKKYSSFTFNTADILQPENESRYPVIFTSNTVEYFRNLYDVLNKLEIRTLNYLIVLMPFHEKFEVIEQETIIDTCNIPILLGNSSLVYAKSVHCNSQYYGEDQLLLIYSKDYKIKKGSVLSYYAECVCSKEQKKLEGKHDELQDEWQKINDELYNSEKNTSQVYIFAGIPYYDIGGGQRSSQLAKTFNKMGYDVYYYYAFDSSESKKFDLRLPLIDHRSINDITVKSVFSSIKKDALFIFEAPYIKFSPYLLRAKELGIKTVYEHIDNWESSLGVLLYDKESFNIFIKESDFLCATSGELLKQIGLYTDKSVSYLPNAVDINIFNPDRAYKYPEDLIRGKEKTLIYFGSLWGEWLHWQLIKNTALSCPESSFNIIGDYSKIINVVHEMPSNVHFLGLKKQYELPAYLYYSDIAILPFKNDDIGRAVSPLKIFEYIAMRKIVLATKLPDIKGYPNTICSDDYNKWTEIIKSDISHEKCADFISENNWYERCSKLLDMTGIDYLKDSASYKKLISIIILNHNNKSVIMRCIDSLIKYKKRYEYEIIVVDNDSFDGSDELLKEVYGEKIKFFENFKNGCSSGRNLGVEHASGNIIVFLDSDQWAVSDRWLDAALYILKKNKGIGAVSWGAGWFDKNSVVGPVAESLPDRGMKPYSLFREDIAYLATSGLVMSKKVFELTDGFDDKYDPTCFEDTDLSFQIKNLGIKIAFTPYINLIHMAHQTTHAGSDAHKKRMNDNGSYFRHKWEKINSSLLEEAWRQKWKK